MPEQSTPRFPPPWRVEQISGGYKILDANGQSLAYVYGRETRADADTANVLTMDEARRIASNIAKLPNYLAANLDGANHAEDAMVELSFLERVSRNLLRIRQNRPEFA
jgi:hypothetical protein